MRFGSRTWFLLSLLLLTASLYFWLLGNEYQKRQSQQPKREQTNEAQPPGKQSSAAAQPLLTTMDSVTAGSRNSAASNVSNNGSTTRTNSPYRLTNSGKSAKELVRSDSAILLKNALVETTAGQQPALPVPGHLRSAEDPGAYIIQAQGPISDEFRARLREVNASVVSYIPNNAYLVTVDKAGAEKLAASPGTRAVMPYEPYYKLTDEKLLKAAVELEELAGDIRLWVTAFPETEAEARNRIHSLGGDIVNEDKSPFGLQFLVRPAPDTLIALSQSPAIQGIERALPRVLMNDLTRVRLGVSTNAVNAPRHLGLSGSNVVININDRGIDASHPDLANRVITIPPGSETDPTGHGTFVAGIIAGNGSQSGTVSSTPPGSETNANFQGIAPSARLISLPFEIDPLSNPITDTYLIETAVRTNMALIGRTNTLISNNSWGYLGATEYNSASARFDAATRDALPGEEGSQPVIYVFSAGDDGEGSDNGDFGNANSIQAPATAKNVIAVGALESGRFITNAYYLDEEGNVIPPPDPASTNQEIVITNAIFLGMTDSSNEVVYFSSRGNTGIGEDGTFGRFKPDVVAPGSFLISARSKDWRLENDVDRDTPEDQAIFDILNELNTQLGPRYRYGYGSSYAAASVSGMLGLIQEFFENRLPSNRRRTLSPALLKALLINGARSAGPRYDFQVGSILNLQGWGVPNLSNSIPALLATEPEDRWPIQLIDQHPTNALATGQTKSWNIIVPAEARSSSLRVTLVWTDPPGNPNAAVKLVNDLDLVVSNKITGEIFYGNNIPASGLFTQASTTNAPAATDVVNNVENVFVEAPGTNYTVSVVGRRVNVNAVPEFHLITGRTNDIVQDFALVISTANAAITNGITLSTETNVIAEVRAPVTRMTNGLPITNQRVGANPRLNEVSAGGTSLRGALNQWNFYVFTNIMETNATTFTTLTNGTNVAFVTFVPPNLSRPRNFEADLDVYVSSDARLLDLEPSVLNAAQRSVGRGGTEAVVYTNATIGQVFYVGVKSADQEGAEYSLVTISSNIPFDQEDNGARVIQGFPLGALIPDGSPSAPGAVQIIGIGIHPALVQRVTVTNVLSHENLGDLLGNLSHNRQFAVLNNHRSSDFRTNIFIYDDSPFSPVPFSTRSDGPGDLNNFVGEYNSGVWLLNMVDNAIGATGRVELLTLRVTPFEEGDLADAGPNGIAASVGPRETRYFYTDAPAEATNMVIRLTQISGPLNVFVRQQELPTPTVFDRSTNMVPPGGEISIGIFDTPPLGGGRYYVAVSNPGDALVNFRIAAIFSFGPGLDFGRSLLVTNVSLPDNAILRSYVDLPVDREVNDVEVGLSFSSQARASDYVFRLISPQGTPIVLSENRGGSLALRDWYGGPGLLITNVPGLPPQAFDMTVFTEDTNTHPNVVPIKFASSPVATILTENTNIFFTLPEETLDILRNQRAIGEWQLEVTGNRAGDTAPALNLGSFDWRLNIEYSFPSEPANFLTNKINYTGTIIDGQTNFFVVEVCETASVAVNTLTGPAGRMVLLADRSGIPTGTSTDDYFPIINTNIVSTNGITTLRMTTNSPIPTPLQPGRRYFLAVHNIDDDPFIVETNSYNIQVVFDRDLCNIPVIRLTNNVPYTNTIAGLAEPFDYYVFTVSSNAIRAEFELIPQNGDLAMLVKKGRPLPDLANRDYAIDSPGITNELLVLTANSPVPLSPGDWYLAVVNTNTNSVNYSIRASEFLRPSTGGGETNYIDPTIVITNGNVCFGWTAQIGYDYYLEAKTNLTDLGWNTVVPRFTATNTAVSVCFALTNFPYQFVRVAEIAPPAEPPPTGVVDGVTVQIIGDDLCVLWPSDVGTTYFVEASTNDISAPIWLQIFSLTATNTNSTYCLPLTNIVSPTYFRVTREVTVPSGVVGLTNGVFYTNSIAGGTNLIQYYSIVVPTNAISATFELIPQNGDLGLLASNGQPLPTRANTDLLSDRPGITNEVIIVNTTNLLQTPLPGTWYLGVLNNSSNTVSYQIRASIELATPTMTNILVNFEYDPASGSLCLSWPSTIGSTYHVQARTSTTNDWDTLTSIVASTGSSTYCVPLGPYRFYRVIEAQVPIIRTLTSGILVTNSISGSTNLISYFRLPVSTNATNVIFEAFPVNADIGLLIRKGSVMGRTNAEFMSDLGGLATERIAVHTGTTPPISAGDWYLGVYSKTAGEVVFSVRATVSERSAVVIPPGTNQAGGLALSGTLLNNQLMLTLDGITNGNYVIEYKTNLSTTNWIVLTNIPATSVVGTNRSVTISDPNVTNSTSRFYRVRPSTP